MMSYVSSLRTKLFQEVQVSVSTTNRLIIFNEKTINSSSLPLLRTWGGSQYHLPFLNKWLAISGNGAMKDGAADKRLIEHWASFLIKKNDCKTPQQTE